VTLPPSPPFRLAPYFHPTTFCIVDDNERFLRSLLLEMPEHLAFRAFSHAEPALEYVNEPIELEPLVDRCYRLEHSARGESVIHFDMTLIEQEIANPQRFRRLSVALIDYAMPSLNGLQFFEKMRDPYTRKAMITGVADEKFAVQLFNAGLIHHFIQKQRATDLESLLVHVAEMQQAYFHQYLARLRYTLDLDPPLFLSDPTVAQYVEQLMAEERLVEYYLVDEPAGLLLLRSNGTVIRLVLLDAAARREQVAFARMHGAPAAIVEGFDNGTLSGYFAGDSPANYHGGEVFPWEEHVVPAVPLVGAEHWTVALVRDPPMDIDFDPARSSYDAYLASLRRD
jgi:CheY-like chemotaxis protein